MPEGVKLIAVSKLKPATDIMEAYGAGQRAFGENYATELRDKAAVLPKDIEWHFIGHLQSKQVKYYIQFVHMIHGVDTPEHLLEVEHAAEKAGREVDVLLQLHVAQEVTKFGFSPDELDELATCRPLNHVRMRGVMGMASHTDDTARIRADFRNIRRTFERLKSGLYATSDCFDVVSMGMSHDWQMAVEEGSTMVRLGTSIFGARDYSHKQ